MLVKVHDLHNINVPFKIIVHSLGVGLQLNKYDIILLS